MSYDLTEEDVKAKLHALDLYIPPNSSRFNIKTNFDGFYQTTLNDISDLPQHHFEKLYPTGSYPGRFYPHVKVHKL